MRALVCRELTGPEGLRIEDWPTPEPAEGTVRIGVRAAALNFADTLITRGTYQEKPDLPFIPGMELAGVVEAVGEGVVTEGPRALTPGMRVLAHLRHGGFAEQVVVPAEHVVPLPETIDDATAAALPVGHGTAYGALVWTARLQSGETLVVHGAAGGAGLAAVECGAALGARVIATARGANRLGVTLARGATEVIDTATEDLRTRIKDLTGGRGADVVFDPVGGATFEASLRAIAWNGRLLVIGFAGGEIQKIPANILLVKNVHALGFAWGTYRKHAPQLIRDGLKTLLRWHGEGWIKPQVSARYPLAQFGEAFRLLVERKSTGKVVLEM